MGMLLGIKKKGLDLIDCRCPSCPTETCYLFCILLVWRWSPQILLRTVLPGLKFSGEKPEWRQRDRPQMRLDTTTYSTTELNTHWCIRMNDKQKEVKRGRLNKTFRQCEGATNTPSSVEMFIPVIRITATRTLYCRNLPSIWRHEGRGLKD